MSKKPTHYEEAEDFDEVIDWQLVYAMDKWDRERVLRVLRPTPKKKVCRKKSLKSTNTTED